jgi:hydrogenase-4 component E
MNLSHIDLLAAFAAVVGVWMCGVMSLRTMLWGLAVQTGLLGVIAWQHGQEIHAAQYLFLAGIVIAVKAAVIPGFLAWVAGRIEVQRDKGISLNPSLALFAGCGALAAGYFLTAQIQGLMPRNPGAAGMAMALLLIGMLLMITRRLAISQMIGFLVLENGIFLNALTQTHGMPLVMYMGVIFDVLVGVMVAGLVIFRLNRSFEHIDVTKLRGLRG